MKSQYIVVTCGPDILFSQNSNLLSIINISFLSPVTKPVYSLSMYRWQENGYGKKEEHVIQIEDRKQCDKEYN